MRTGADGGAAVAPVAALVAALAACGVAPAPAEPWVWALPPGFPAPPVPADNPMSAEKVALGRALFLDVRLSGNQTQSCASCHDPARAFADGRATSIGATGEPGRRNAPSLVNVAYASSLTWASLETSLEQQALVPMFGAAPVELGAVPDEVVARLAADPELAARFAAAFPEDEPVSIRNVARALAAFQRTLISGGSRFDRFLAGDDAALDAAERRGLELFESPALGCATCHGGFNLSAATLDAPVFFNTGLYAASPAHDRGLAEVTGDPAHDGRYKPPSLRDVAVTAPYMHDGSLATLGDVVDFYARGGEPNPRKSGRITGFALPAADREALIHFLGALTGEDSRPTWDPLTPARRPAARDPPR